MADRIFLMEAGRLMQAGPPAEVYARPASAFAAMFFSNINELEGVVKEGAVTTPLGPVPAPGLTGRVKILFRPESLELRPLDNAHLAGTVTEARFIGVAWLVRVEAPSANGHALDLQVRMTDRHPPEPGQRVSLRLDPTQAFVFGA